MWLWSRCWYLGTSKTKPWRWRCPQQHVWSPLRAPEWALETLVTELASFSQIVPGASSRHGAPWTPGFVNMMCKQNFSIFYGIGCILLQSTSSNLRLPPVLRCTDFVYVSPGEHQHPWVHLIIFGLCLQLNPNMYLCCDRTLGPACHSAIPCFSETNSVLAPNAHRPVPHFASRDCKLA